MALESMDNKKLSACLQRKMMKNSTDVIFSICHLLDDWNVLQKEKVSRNMQRVSDCGRPQ
jgi:uncharacterized protein (UPF0147 family)